MTTNSLGIYIHIPFCARKCNYCDFLSFKCEESRPLREYARALVEEIKLQGAKWHYRTVETVFIGGGTPSLMGSSEIKTVMDALREHFNISEDAEITIESNPMSLTNDKLTMYGEVGINRLSIGIQSFDNQILEFLGRLHDKNEAMRAYQKAKRAGFDNINIDLMFGIPGQSMKKWRDTVRQAIFLRPQHISLYSLSIEDGTPLHERLLKEEFKETPDIVDRDMYHEALNMLNEAGYSHYEISNVALPGKEGAHNIKYWSYEEYLGLGLGASSFIEGKRYKNVDGMLDYIRCIKRHEAPIEEGSVEDYSLRDEMGIYVFTGLRKASGISLEHFRRTFGKELFQVYDESVLSRNKGLLIRDGDRLYLTEYGMDVSNRIMSEFV